jgi:hypothetical protein
MLEGGGAAGGQHDNHRQGDRHAAEERFAQDEVHGGIGLLRSIRLGVKKKRAAAKAR